MNENVKKSSITLREWMKYLSNKSEHYPISDEFIKKYQQSPKSKKGYIYYAWETSHTINKIIAEPNQKWHFFESYILRLLCDNKISLDDSAEKIYGRIKCPELLLWIAEACGIKEEDVIYASKEAQEIIVKNTSARNSASRRIHELILWTDVEIVIRDYIKSSESC